MPADKRGQCQKCGHRCKLTAALCAICIEDESDSTAHMTAAELDAFVEEQRKTLPQTKTEAARAQMAKINAVRGRR